MKELVILIGNIGCGKTTLTAKYQKRGYIVISRDQIRYAIGNGVYTFDTQYEPAIWNIEDTMLEEFASIGVNIVVDEVGINRRLREKYIQVGKQYKYKIVGIELPRLSMRTAVTVTR